MPPPNLLGKVLRRLRGGDTRCTPYDVGGDGLAMMGGNDKLTMAGPGKPRCFWAVATTWLLAASLSAAAGTAVAGDGQAPADDTAAAKVVQPAPEKPALPAPPAPGLSFPAQPPAVNKPGFLHEFGRWWDDARGKFEDFKKKSDDAAKGAAAATQDAMKNAAEATGNAATAIVRLPNLRMIEVHERCATAANGAPDCQAAATNACRGKGFSSGRPAGVQSSQNCPPAVLLSGRTPAAGECPVETVVLLAACQ